MSETARLLGTPGEISWKGKPLLVSRVTFPIEGYYELWLENCLAAGLERARAVNSPAVYRDRLREGNLQIATGAFDWQNPEIQDSAWKTRGFKELAFHCISELQPAWTRAEHEELFRDDAKVKELIQIIHRIGDPHPNGRSPAPPAAGQPSPEANGSPSCAPTAA